MSISHRDLFERARVFKFENDPSLLRFILETKKMENVDDIDSLDIDLFLTSFLRLAKKKWKDAGSHVHNMEKKYGGWLTQEADVPDFNPKPKKTTPQTSKDFRELSKSSKNRVTAELRASHEAPKLVHAAKTALKKEGKHDLAFVIDEAGSSPGRATKFRRLSEWPSLWTRPLERPSIFQPRLRLTTLSLSFFIPTRREMPTPATAS